MGKLTRANYDDIRDHLFDRIHTSGEEMKNDFPNVLRTAIQTETWKYFFHADGRAFENVVDWLVCPFPIGLGMGQGRHVISYEDALTLTKSTPDVHRILVENAPSRKPGRPPENQGNNGTSTSRSPLSTLPRHDRSTSNVVLSVRLAQEKPKYYEAYLRGDYKSVTAAATDAGLLKNDGNMRRGKSAFRKMSEPERKQFLQWI